MSPQTSAQPQFPVSFYRLTRNFALGAAAVLVLTAGVMLHMLDTGKREQLTALAAENNADFTRSFANILWQTHQSHISTARRLNPDAIRALPGTAALRRDIARLAQGLSVLKVKLYDRHGFTAFSTEPKQIGSDYGDNPRFRRTINGSDAAVLEFRDRFNAITGPVSARWVLSSYVPIRKSWPKGAIMGVAEVYRDVTPLVAKITASRARDTAIVTGAFLFAFALLVVLIWRADSLMRAQHRANLRLNIAMSRIQAASGAKGEFLGHMSHELRTPLNAIIGFSELIRDEIKGPIGNKVYKSYVEDICSSGHQLLDMIEHVLDLVKVENGKMEIIPAPTHITEEAHQVMRMFTPMIEKTGQILTVDVQGPKRMIETDPSKLRQILINLVSNAVKFTPPGGQIQFEIDQSKDHESRISVIDTGSGMSKDDIQTARAPFGQVKNRFARDHKGTGLGLPLCLKLAELLGGTLDIQSTPDQGTTGSLTLPNQLTGKPANDPTPLPVELKVATG
jgi:signal transduction histidine kinase